MRRGSGGSPDTEEQSWTAADQIRAAGHSQPVNRFITNLRHNNMPSRSFVSNIG